MHRIFASLLLVGACFLVAPLAAVAVTIPTVPVGNAGDVADTTVMNDGTTGYGSVAYDYRIGTTEVTNAQYVDFLNAKAKSDPLGLYNLEMDIRLRDGITQVGSSTNFSYAPKTNMAE